MVSLDVFAAARICVPSPRCWGEAADCCVGGCWACWDVGGASIKTGSISSCVGDGGWSLIQDVRFGQQIQFSADTCKLANLQ